MTEEMLSFLKGTYITMKTTAPISSVNLKTTKTLNKKWSKKEEDQAKVLMIVILITTYRSNNKCTRFFYSMQRVFIEQQCRSSRTLLN